MTSVMSPSKSPFTCRTDAIIWARTLIADPSVVFLDTETSGLGETAEIVDIAVVDLSGAVLLDTLVFATLPIPAEATRVHGISDTAVLNAPMWGIVARTLATVIEDRTVVVYNASFDFGMVNQCNRSIGLPEIVGEWQCCMLAFAAYRGIRGYRNDFRWHRLGAAAEHFGVVPGNHRALADAETCRQIVFALAREEV